MRPPCASINGYVICFSYMLGGAERTWGTQVCNLQHMIIVVELNKYMMLVV
jgi:hypothetical protein